MTKILGKNDKNIRKKMTKILEQNDKNIRKK